jgi:hypothetical protein
MRRNHTGLTQEERSKKLSELQIMLAASPKQSPVIELPIELQPVVEEVKELEEFIREAT